MSSIAPTASFAANSADAPDSRRMLSSRDEAPQFSYALAAASLEDQASKSLKAHGAAPQGDAAARGRTRSEGASRDSAKRAELPESSDAATPAATPEGAGRAASATKSATGEPSVAAANAAPVASAAPTLPAAPSGTQSTKAAEAIPARDAATLAKAKASVAKATRPAEPAALKTEFAEILAKRLEKTSVFDLRLDPPELGRVEGRLAVNDDGKAVLSLTFDSQNAFDLFSRDEGALRQALAQAGLDFGAGDFVFAFRERASESHAFITDVDGAAAAETPRNYDPAFFASWSAGALDIRI